MSRYGSLIRLFVCAAFTAFVLLPSLASAQDNERQSLDAISLDEANDQDSAQDSNYLLPSDDSDDSDDDDAIDDNASDDANHDNAATSNGDSRVLGHGFQLGMTFLGVPGYLIDNWFVEHGNVWQNGAVNMGFSLDYFLRFKAPCEMRFSLSWVNARTGDAYWLDKNYSDKPHLADYVVNNYSSINLEIAAYHVVKIIDEIAFYYGGGIWGGVVLDDAKSYAIRSNCESLNGDLQACPHEPGHVPMTQMPPAFGFIMATIGFKFTLWETMTIRAEGGFKGYFYGQLGLGVEF